MSGTGVKGERFQIGNNRGGINGWITPRQIAPPRSGVFELSDTVRETGGTDASPTNSDIAVKQELSYPSVAAGSTVPPPTTSVSSTRSAPARFPRSHAPRSIRCFVIRSRR